MSACLSDDELLDIVRGTLALAEAPALEAHLADCPVCSAALATALVSPAQDDPAQAPSREGRTLGPYRLGARIGAGGMGEIYRAWDERLGRHVAVKVLSPRVAGSPEQVRRLVTEGRAAAAIAHPNVVSVFDAGTEDGVPFIVSELCKGETLRSRIERGAIPREQAVGLCLQLVKGLAAAHAGGIIHRDLKPENLMILSSGTLKILDFGLAKLTGERAGDLDATEPGAVLGTAGYLSPEQARGEPGDARSDIFAVGAILYEMLAGKRAFDGSTFAERLSALLRDEPARLADGTLGDLAPIVTRCLEKDPARRFQSAEDLAWVLGGGAVVGGSVRPPAPVKTVSRRLFLSVTAAAGIAGVAIGRLGGSWRGAQSGSFLSSPSYEQLTYRHGRVTTARFTPDGASVVYAASWDGLPLAITTTRLGGGGARLLALPSAELLSLSSRGEIAISLGHRYVEGFHTAGQLAVAPIENGEPRPLAMDIQEADYTPDGRELAVIRRAGQVFRLELPLDHVLFEGAWLSHARVSPDGKQVACLVHPSPHDDRGGVVLVERATGRSRTVSEGWSSIVGLGFSPDGRGLWFSGAREGGNNGIVAIDLEGRQIGGQRTTGRLRLHDVSKDGKVAITHDTWTMPLRVRAPGATAEVDLSLSDISMVADISADGKTIVFAEVGDIESARGTYLRSTLSGQALRLGDGGAMALSDDGRHVLGMVFEPSPGLLVFSTSEGETRNLPLGPLEDVGWAAWRGDLIVLGGSAQGRPRRLWRTSLSAASPVPLTPEGLFGRGHLDASGRVAFVAPDGRLLVVSVATPESMEVVPGNYPGEMVCGFAEGGREVFLRTRSLPLRIRRVAIATGSSAPHLEITPPPVGLKGVESVVISESGSAYAYSYGQELSRLYAMSFPVPA